MEELEEWKQYTGEHVELHGYVWVSNMGRIYKIGTNTSKNKSRILNGTKSSQGYMRLHCSINGKVYNVPIHRLVAETFCENDDPDNRKYVDHINAIRDDNRAENLRWVTTSENCRNPIYVKKLKKRLSEYQHETNLFGKLRKEPLLLENKNGTMMYFPSLKSVYEYFGTKANLNRKIKSGEYFTSHKSKLYGWKVSLCSSSQYKA